jgi:hypothetical protein
MRRAASTTAIILGLAVMAAGCAKSSSPNAAATANTNLTSSESPAASAAPSAGTSASPATGGGCGISGTVTGGGGTALDVMRSWLKCDSAKLRTLLQDTAYAQLSALGTPKIDMHWSQVGCGGAAGSTYCTYRNKLGSDVIIKLRNEPGPKPVTEFRLDSTIYHDNAEKYAREFLDAFANHNKPRMVALASQSIVDSIVVDAPPAGYTLTLTPEPHWVYSAQFTATGEYWLVTIHGTLGKAHAITAFGNAG